MGGQIGDTGTLTTSSNETHAILDTQVKNGVFLHIVETQSTLAGTVLKDKPSKGQAIQRHLPPPFELGTKNTFRKPYQQAGSLVEDNRLRFDLDILKR